MVTLLITLATDLVYRLPLPALLLILASVLLWWFIFLFIIVFSPKGAARIVQVIAAFHPIWYRSRKYRSHKHNSRRHAR